MKQCFSNLMLWITIFTLVTYNVVKCSSAFGYSELAPNEADNFADKDGSDNFASRKKRGTATVRRNLRAIEESEGKGEDVEGEKLYREKRTPYYPATGVYYPYPPPPVYTQPVYPLYPPAYAPYPRRGYPYRRDYYRSRSHRRGHEWETTEERRTPSTISKFSTKTSISESSIKTWIKFSIKRWWPKEGKCFHYKTANTDNELLFKKREILCMDYRI
ncbi:unnamed protein product [Gordionus sp. m RMFG-2023]